MGIKGLQTIIDNNLGLICGSAQKIQGHLVIDGVNILHELYLHYNLDWANGGCYSKVHEVTVKFFDDLQKTGVQPIVIMGGAGVESHLQDKVYRRNLSISDIPACIERAHTPRHSESRHFLPELSRMTFVSAVKERSSVLLYFADGKANTTVVKLANFYGCPVLGNDTNYCIFNVFHGVILYRHLSLDLSTNTCTARVIKRGQLFQGYITINHQSLILAMVAILGDGGPALPDLYYGSSDLKRMIDSRLGAAYSGDRDQDRLVNVAKFLESFRSLENFRIKIDFFRLSENFKSQLRVSCGKAQQFYADSSPMSCDFLQEHTMIQCSHPQCDLPPFLVQQFRNGDIPNFLMDAIALGKCYLCQQVGDKNQPPVVVLGCPIREAAYGYVRKLMSHQSAKMIIEYHRNAFGTKQGLNYSEHQVEPDHSTRKRLGAKKISELTEEKRKKLAKEAICTTFGCMLEDISMFENNEERSWMLVAALTRFWARHQLVKQSLPDCNRIFHSLIYSFVKCSSRVQDQQIPQDDPLPDTFRDPNWIKAYHAALEWQCLYTDTVGLNAILMQPFEMPSPACLYNGEIVLHYGLLGGIEVQVERLSQKERQLYDKLIAAILPSN